MNNEKKLQTWYEQIKKYKRIDLNEAKQILLKINTTTNIEEKQKLREKLILGTLYLGYEMFNDSLFLELYYGYYDIEDIINAFVIEWINIIDSNVIMSVKSFRMLLRSYFYNKLFKNVTNNDHTILENFNKDNFNQIFTWYFSNKLSNENLSFNNFYDYVEQLIDKSKKTNMRYKILQLFTCLEELYLFFIQNNTDINKILEIKNVFKYKEFVLNYFLNKIDEDDLIQLYKNDDQLIRVERIEFNKKFMEYIKKNKKINKKLTTLMYYRYGFEDGKCYTENEVGEILGLTHQIIHQLDEQLKSRILKQKKIDNYKVGYYE